MKNWQLQTAKAKLSLVVKEAQLEPQWITVHGKPEVVVLSNAEYERLIGSRESLYDRLQASPLKGLNLKLTRNKSGTRNVKL